MAVLGGAEATAVLPLLLSISISWLGIGGAGRARSVYTCSLLKRDTKRGYGHSSR